MKTFAITYLSEVETDVETLTVQSETIDEALQNFTLTSNWEIRVVGLEEITYTRKNL